MTKIFTWVLAGISAYLLWGNITWLSVVVILLALSFDVSPEEALTYEVIGHYDNTTGRRLMLTTLMVVIIFIYSLCI